MLTKNRLQPTSRKILPVLYLTALLLPLFASAADDLKYRFVGELGTTFAGYDREAPLNPGFYFVSEKANYPVLFSDLNLKYAINADQYLEVTGFASHEGRPEAEEENRATAREAYYSFYLKDFRFILGRYVFDKTNAYFFSPARSMPFGWRSADNERSFGREYKIGNDMLRVSAKLGQIEAVLYTARLENRDISDTKEEKWIAGLMLAYDSEDWGTYLMIRESKAGISATYNYGTDSVLYFEAAVSDKSVLPRPVMAAEEIRTPTYTFLARYDYELKESGFNEFSAGINYTAASSGWNTIFEYFHNGDGWNEEEWKTAQAGIDAANLNDAYKNTAFETAAGNPYEGFIGKSLRITERYFPRRDYLAVRFHNSDLVWEIEPEIILIYSADDGGTIHRYSLKRYFFSRYYARCEARTVTGPKNSFAGLNPRPNQFTAAIGLIF